MWGLAVFMEEKGRVGFWGRENSCFSPAIPTETVCPLAGKGGDGTGDLCVTICSTPVGTKFKPVRKHTIWV